MDIDEAINHIKSILDEERMLPTVHYFDPIFEWPASPEALKAIKGREKHADTPRLNLHTLRNKRPRDVQESPDDYVFRSINFDLLVTVFRQLPEAQRREFIAAFLARIPIARSKRPPEARFPCYLHQMSELPLVAEFCVRMGYTKELLSALASLDNPNVGVLLMMWELEEMIALNFTLFSKQELSTMIEMLGPFSKTCTKIAATGKAKRTQHGMTFRPEPSDIDALAEEVLKSIAGIREECRKAQYFYLKDSLLQQTPNLEIEGDKIKVENFLAKLGFNGKLLGALNAAESDYKSSSNPFELKNCLGHLRSFLEHLHREAAKSVAAAANETVIDGWGPAISYLRGKDYITIQHEKFVTSLYTLISDEGVHALGAEREYARLLRNVVIEYGVMFLSVLDKTGFEIQS
ncbi:MAG: hypothetical protein WBR26_09105 [Candidatus Acidiferrum sp.]